MFAKTFLAVALAGAATAVTPSGFQPSSNSDLIVAFGDTLALNGKSMTKAETASQPTIGTTTRLTGTYAIMMVDPDIPPQTAGGATGELLHWMAVGLTSSNSSTMIGGMQVFVLRSATNASAASDPAPYFGPSPPNKAPNTHRYTQLLLDTTGNTAAETALMTAAKTRNPFDAVAVVNAAGVKVVAGNSFDVTNGTSTSSSGGSGNGAGGNLTAITMPANGSGTIGGNNGTKPAAAPINSATLVQSNITKVTSAPQVPGGAMSTGTPVAGGNGTGMGTGMDPNAANGTAPAAGANGTMGAGPKSGAIKTVGLAQSGGGAYVAGLLALAATLFLL